MDRDIEAIVNTINQRLANTSYRANSFKYGANSYSISIERGLEEACHIMYQPLSANPVNMVRYKPHKIIKSYPSIHHNEFLNYLASISWYLNSSSS